MAIELTEHENGKILEVAVSGKLNADDYAVWVPKLEQLINQHGKVRILFVMHDFHGWTLSAMWEDLKFDLKHFRDIERLAMVGQTKWQQGMAAFCRPFTTAKIRYFDHDQIDAARAWVKEE